MDKVEEFTHKVTEYASLQAVLIDSEGLSSTVQALEEFYSEKLILIFKEITKFSESSLHYYCNVATDQELIIQMMLICPLMEDMPMTTIAAAIASQDHIFKNQNERDMAANLDKYSLYPENLVKEALSILQRLTDLGIMLIPNIVQNTFRAYRKNTHNLFASNSKFTDDQIRNSIVFKRLIKYMSEIIKQKLHTAITFCLQKSVINEVHEVCSHKAMLLGLLNSLMRNDAVLSSSLIFMVSFIKNDLNLPCFINWLRKTRCIAADDLLAAGNFLLSLKRSLLFEIPLGGEEVILYIMNAFNVPTDFISREPAKRCASAPIALPTNLTRHTVHTMPRNNLAEAQISVISLEPVVQAVLDSLRDRGIQLNNEDVLELYEDLIKTVAEECLPPTTEYIVT